VSIVEPGSVLILGAGSSNDFGLPLGGQLIDTIKSVTLKTERLQDQWDETVEVPSRWFEKLSRPNEGLKNPIGALLNYQYLAGKASILLTSFARRGWKRSSLARRSTTKRQTRSTTLFR
jgi:hypothetical protein